MISDISQLLQLWRTSATLTCKSWLLCNHSNKNCRLRFPSVYVLCSHVKEGSAVEEIGFSRSNRISALLIALQPDLAQVVLVLVNSSKASPQWLNLHGLKSVTYSGLLSTVSVCFTCCFFFPFVINSLIYLLLPPDIWGHERVSLMQVRWHPLHYQLWVLLSQEGWQTWGTYDFCLPISRNKCSVTFLFFFTLGLFNIRGLRHYKSTTRACSLFITKH